MTHQQIEMSAELLNGVADKIDALDFTEAERAVMDVILARAASNGVAEVSGFQVGLFLFPPEFLKSPDLRTGGCKVAAACGYWEPDTGFDSV